MRLIDADELQSIFNATTTELLKDKDLQKDIEHVVRACLMTTEMIKDAPTVDAVCKGVFDQYKWERDTALATLEEHGLSLGQAKRHGKWIVGDDYECSECECMSAEKTAYCGNCGAKMQGEEE